MAVVRLVNGVADAGQTRRVAASVADLSAAAGLPRALVDLRHEATHNELPRVVALEAGAAAGLVWLEENYWRAQRGALASRFAADTYSLPESAAAQVGAAD
jgi:ribosomal biogenesis protein LAS1